MANFLERLVSGDKRTLAKLEKKAEQVMALDEKMRSLSQDRTDQCIQRTLPKRGNTGRFAAGSICGSP